jgi:pimeloyl-ACP methyl ester carboxylesterase
LAAAGYHAVAPDTRGYGQTDAPPNITDALPNIQDYTRFGCDGCSQWLLTMLIGRKMRQPA